MADAHELQIYDPRERRLVALADRVLAAGAAVRRLLPRRAAPTPPKRILLLRLERIGDLLMSAGAIESVRALAPGARLDLVVGSWNLAVAKRLRGIDRIETLDAPWLARGGDAATPIGLIARAEAWRHHAYDLAINFEGDIRSHALLAIAGVPRRVGFAMAGGGPLLTDVVPHRPDRHVSANAAALIAAAFAGDPVATVEAPPPAFRLDLPAEAIAAAAAQVPHGPYIAVHASGGRAIKQWDLDRFAAAASTIAADLGAGIVLTGASGDAALVETVRSQILQLRRESRRETLPTSLPTSLPTNDLLLTAAILRGARMVLTGDTGPMHLAAAVGAPVVAVFGPSMPWRYGPISTAHRIVRVDLPCAPCNMIRKPPERCVGHTPDCLVGVTVDAVVEAARSLLAETAARPTGEAPG